MSRGQWLALGSTLALVGCNDPTSHTLPDPPLVDATSESEIRAQDVADELQGESDAPTPMDVSNDADVATADASDIDEDVRWDAGNDEDSPLDVADADAGDPDAVSPDAGSSGDAAISDAARDVGTTFPCTSLPDCPNCPVILCQRSTEFCYVSGGIQCFSYGDPIDGAGWPSYPAQCMPTPTCACLAQVPWYTCPCTDDGAGGVTTHCNGCYGSPPARWERKWAREAA